MKIKFIWLLFFILIFSGCNIIEVKEKIYISSIGIDYDYLEEKFIITGFSPNLYKVQEQQGVSSQINKSFVTASDNSLENIIDKIDKSIPLSVDFKHIKSVILQKNFFKKDENILKLLNFFLNNEILHLGAYVFYTDNDILQLFKGGLPDDTSLLYNLITNPNDNILKLPKIYRLTINLLAEHYLEENANLVFPWIKIYNNYWSDTTNSDLNVVSVNGLVFYKKENGNIYEVDDKIYLGINYLYNKEKNLLTLNDKTYLITNYKIKQKYKDKDNSVYFDIKFKLSNSSNINKKIKSEIKDEIIKLIKNVIDYANLNEFDILNLKENYFRNNNASINIDFKGIKFYYKIEIV